MLFFFCKQKLRAPAFRTKRGTLYRKKLVVQPQRREGVYNRAAQANETFFGRGAATPHKSFSPLGGKRKSGVWRDEVVKRSKNNRAKAIVIFTGATTGLFSEEEQ